MKIYIKSLVFFLLAIGVIGILQAFHFQPVKTSNVSARSAARNDRAQNSVTVSSTSFETQRKNEEWVLVTRIIDGDTMEIESGQKVRYIGVDAPESVHPKKKVQCFGKEASAYNQHLVAGQPVRLKKDISETDKYGRLLRYVYLSDGTFVNLKLVEEGYANVDTFPPDVKYSKLFIAAARKAREENKGLWRGCGK